jgi:hypothetical protein
MLGERDWAREENQRREEKMERQRGKKRKISVSNS